jgi:hypothetical protein
VKNGKIVTTSELWAKTTPLMRISQSASTSVVTVEMRVAVWMDFFKPNFLQLLLFLPASIYFKIL